MTKLLILVLSLLTALSMAQNLRLSNQETVFQNLNSYSGAPSASIPPSSPPTRAQHQFVPPVQKKQQNFGDVTLDHHVPSIFLTGEVFQVKGTVNSTRLFSYLRTQPASTQVYYINIVLYNQESGDRVIYKKRMFRSETKFTHQCFFKNEGKYHFGISISERVTFTPKIYSIVNPGDIPHKTMASAVTLEKPNSVTIEVVDNNLFVKWGSKNKLTKVTISQTLPTENRKEFIVSNDATYFEVPYSEFGNFTKSVTRIEIRHAESSDICAYDQSSDFSEGYGIEINVTEHLFQEVQYNEVIIDGQIKSKVSVAEEVEIKGTSEEQIEETALVVEPDNKIIEKEIEVQQYSRVKRFKFHQRMDNEGIYIIQINHKDGYALINTPIYAGTAFPLLPDFSDLHPEIKVQEAKIRPLNEMRQVMLDLINERRRQFGVQEVVLDQELNKLAQMHSQDMGVRNYVSHKNLEGENSGKRAQKMGIYSPVGENIAINEDVEYAQFRLDRSPVHLKNTINPMWTRVGIGIFRKYNGVYYITQQFSTQDLSKIPLTNSGVSDIRSGLLTYLNKRSSANIIENKSLSQKVQEWYSDNTLNDLSGLKVILKEEKVRGAKVVHFTTSFTSSYLDFVDEHGFFDYMGLNNVGFGMKVYKGTLDVIMILF